MVYQESRLDSCYEEPSTVNFISLFIGILGFSYSPPAGFTGWKTSLQILKASLLSTDLKLQIKLIVQQMTRKILRMNLDKLVRLVGMSVEYRVIHSLVTSLFSHLLPRGLPVRAQTLQTLYLTYHRVPMLFGLLCLEENCTEFKLSWHLQ